MFSPILSLVSCFRTTKASVTTHSAVSPGGPAGEVGRQRTSRQILRLLYGPQELGKRSFSFLSQPTVHNRKNEDTDKQQISIEIVIICHEELQTILLRMSNIPSISLFQNTKTKLPFGQLVTRSPTGTSSRSCSETFLAPAGAGGTVPGSAEGMETSQPSFPPSPPSLRTKGKTAGGKDRKRKITYVGNTGGWGVLCHLVGWQAQAQLQPPREGGDPREEGSRGRLHCPEHPQLPTHRSQGTEHGQQGCVGAAPWGPRHQGARWQVLTSVNAGKGLEMSPHER